MHIVTVNLSCHIRRSRMSHTYLQSYTYVSHLCYILPKVSCIDLAIVGTVVQKVDSAVNIQIFLYSESKSAD